MNICLKLNHAALYGSESVRQQSGLLHWGGISCCSRILRQPGTTFRLGGSEAADSAIRLIRSTAHEKGEEKARQSLVHCFWLTFLIAKAHCALSVLICWCAEHFCVTM